MRKFVLIFLLVFSILISSCNNYQLVKVTSTPESSSTPYPTYTPYPTHTQLPTATPYPTDIALNKLRPNDVTCLTEDMWVDSIRTFTNLNPDFYILPEDANWDQEWSLDESYSDGPGGIYDLAFNEDGGCITSASSMVIIDAEMRNFYKRDLFLDLVRGFFSDTDGGSWYKEQLNKCSSDDEVLEDKKMNDGTIWRVFCEYHPDHDIQMFSLIIALPY